MGISGIGWQQLLIVLGIVAVLFGTSRLRTIGSDLGTAVRDWKLNMREIEKIEEQTKEEE